MKSHPERLQIERFKWSNVVIPLTAIALITFFLFVGLKLTGQPSSCGNCHQTYLESWQKSKHKSATCEDCHQEPGLVGALIQRAETLRNLADSKRPGPTLSPYINMELCLECHQNILTKTTKTSDGVKVRHKEIIDEGLNCSRCHSRTGHVSKTDNARRPVHDTCFTCHQIQGISTDCALCHTRDIGETRAHKIDAYRKVQMRLDKCDDCHSAEGCTECHPNERIFSTF